jgi:hypothetical protein
MFSLLASSTDWERVRYCSLVNCADRNESFSQSNETGSRLLTSLGHNERSSAEADFSTDAILATSYHFSCSSVGTRTATRTDVFLQFRGTLVEPLLVEVLLVTVFTLSEA